MHPIPGRVLRRGIARERETKGMIDDKSREAGPPSRSVIGPNGIREDTSTGLQDLGTHLGARVAVQNLPSVVITELELHKSLPGPDHEALPLKMGRDHDYVMREMRDPDVEATRRMVAKQCVKGHTVAVRKMAIIPTGGDLDSRNRCTIDIVALAPVREVLGASQREARAITGGVLVQILQSKSRGGVTGNQGKDDLLQLGPNRLTIASPKITILV